jgi:hypothetical protein
MVGNIRSWVFHGQCRWCALAYPKLARQWIEKERPEWQCSMGLDEVTKKGHSRDI